VTNLRNGFDLRTVKSPRTTLFDQGSPVPLPQFLVGHTVSTSAREGWSRYENSDLLNAAEAAGSDVLVATDKMTKSALPTESYSGEDCFIVLLKQQWPDLRRHVHLVVAAIDVATFGPIPRWRFRNPPL
jgi:hypothetical protein